MKNRLLFFLFFVNHFVTVSQCEHVSVQLTTNFSPFEISSIIESDGLRNGDDYNDATLYFPINNNENLKSIILVPGYQATQSSVTLWAEYLAERGMVSMTIGTNTIAVRVLDLSGGGGVYKGDLCIKDGNNILVSLKGDWKFKMLGCFEKPSAFRLFDDNFNLENRPKLTLSPKTPTTLYNAMIAPLVPFKIKGAIWYQGENNVPHAEEYTKSFPLMIKAWRDKWNQGDSPFYYVQIAPHDYGSNKAPLLREAQRLAMKLPNTGIVVTSDIGSLETIHPANKQDVGKRLALWALNKTYGKKDVIYSGPLYKSIITEENSIRVNFDTLGSGLFCPDTTLTFFEIAGEDGKYYPAEAKIDGEQVVVRSSKVKQPVHVRFGWTDTATPNLFNKEGLPAASFSSE